MYAYYKFPGACGNSAANCMPVRRAKDVSLRRFPSLPIALSCSVALCWRQTLRPIIRETIRAVFSLKFARGQVGHTVSSARVRAVAATLSTMYILLR
jgi:hypothetical protein